MIMDRAGEPEVRCIVCGERSIDHPTFAHWAWNWLAAISVFTRYHLKAVVR